MDARQGEQCLHAKPTPKILRGRKIGTNSIQKMPVNQKTLPETHETRDAIKMSTLNAAQCSNVYQKQCNGLQS